MLAWAFFKSAIDLWDPANSESGDSWFGVGPPFIIGIGGLLVGVLLMLSSRSAQNPEFFRRKIRVAPPGSLDARPLRLRSPAGRPCQASARRNRGEPIGWRPRMTGTQPDEDPAKTDRG